MPRIPPHGLALLGATALPTLVAVLAAAAIAAAAALALLASALMLCPAGRSGVLHQAVALVLFTSAAALALAHG